jgi:hypothetical protein
VVLAAGIAATASSLEAGIITLPPGVNPGDTYRLIFVTSTTRDATSTNINDYNAFVANVAASIPQLAALGATWKDIGSTATVNAIDNIGASASNVGIYRLDGSLAASGTAAFLSYAEFSDPVFTFFDETGAPAAAGGIWLGTDWNSGGTGLGVPGHQLGTSLPRSSGGDAIGQLSGRFYAISSDITAPTPEPGVAGLTSLGGALLLLVASLKRAGRGNRG